jgi:hypothetical protein
MLCTQACNLIMSALKLVTRHFYRLADMSECWHWTVLIFYENLKAPTMYRGRYAVQVAGVGLV